MTDDDTCSVRTWAASGAMALTGRRGGAPLGPPRGLVERVGELGALFAAHTAVELDALALLGERAALADLGPGGDVSCGGATRLLPAAGGWVALGLPRPEDVELVPALVEGVVGADPWPAVAAFASAGPSAAFVERARLLGLPAAELPADPVAWAEPVAEHPIAGAAAPARPIGGARVVDLGALWAGPLCGSLLASAGADVVKVESSRRPDGARRGPTAFFDLLNGGKASVALDLRSHEGARTLRRLIASADVVIEASRPRALRQLGIDAEEMVAGGPQVWVSITGHGRAAPGAGWVAFGDDAAVEGGLVVRDGTGPCFCADAVADPLTGLVAAVAALDALATGGRWMLDVAMAAVARWATGPTLAVPVGVTAAPPAARVPVDSAPALGEHTDAVLAAWVP